MRAILIAAIFGLASTAAQAQVKESITLRQGQQTVLQFSEPFSVTTVGDPSLLDILPRSDRVVVLVAKQSGVTDVLVLDASRVQRQITVEVLPPDPVRIPGLILIHNRKSLSDYLTYICAGTPCRRVRSAFEGKDGPTSYSVIESHNVNENTNK